MRFVILAMMVLACNVEAAEVYKWIGPDGRAHFGDRPPAEAQVEEINIRSFNGPAEVTKESDARAENIVLLTTTWCGVCKQARQYLSAKGISYTELDVEKSDAGRAEYKRLNGRGVPIILVGERRMNGFSASQLDQLLKQAGF